MDRVTVVVEVVVPPRHCDAQGRLHACRYYEYFEDAFLHWLSTHAGGYATVRASGADLVVAASGCEHHAAPALGDALAIEVGPVAAGQTSLWISFTVRDQAEQLLADGYTRYVAVSAAGAVPLPASLRALTRGLPRRPPEAAEWARPVSG